MNIDSELIANPQGGSVAAKISLEEFKSMYYWLNAKPDTEIKIFPEVKRISINDIYDLHEKVTEKIKNHETLTQLTTVVVTLSNNKTLNFGTWEQFTRQDWKIGAHIKSISINWDFNIKIPGFGLPQRHTLKIRLGSSVKPQEMIHLMMSSEEDLEIAEVMAPIICKVDFINPIISNELFDIVTRWHESLPKRDDEGRLFKFLFKHQRKIEQLLVVLSFSVGATSLYAFSKILLIKYNVDFHSAIFVQKLFAWLLIAFITMYLFYIIGTFWGDRLVRKIKDLDPPVMFTITKGDLNKNESIAKSNTSIVKQVGIEVSLAILLSILGYIGNKILNYGIQFFTN